MLNIARYKFCIIVRNGIVNIFCKKMKIRISRIWCYIYKKPFLLSYYERVSRTRNDKRGSKFIAIFLSSNT